MLDNPWSSNFSVSALTEQEAWPPQCDPALSTLTAIPRDQDVWPYPIRSQPSGAQWSLMMDKLLYASRKKKRSMASQAVSPRVQ